MIINFKEYIKEDVENQFFKTRKDIERMDI